MPLQSKAFKNHTYDISNNSNKVHWLGYNYYLTILDLNLQPCSIISALSFALNINDNGGLKIKIYER